jgi:hypothetical protein
LPEQAVVHQEGMGGAVGIVHHQETAGVGHFQKINISILQYIYGVCVHLQM